MGERGDRAYAVGEAMRRKNVNRDSCLVSRDPVSVALDEFLAAALRLAIAIDRRVSESRTPAKAVKR